GLARVARLEALDPVCLGFFDRFDVRGDADVTGALVTLATDRAAHGDHRHRREADPVRAEQDRLHGIGAGLHAAVAPQLDTVAQPGVDQRAVRLDHADLGGQAD